MPSVTRLDLEAPMRSLREAAGLENPHAAAGKRGVRYSVQRRAEDRGSHTTIATLQRAAGAFGLKLVLSVEVEATEPAEDRPNTKKASARSHPRARR